MKIIVRITLVFALLGALSLQIWPQHANGRTIEVNGTSMEAGELALSDRHRQVSRKVTEFMERFHYRRARVDNALSSAILDRYLDNLDGQRLYLLASDVSNFNRYRFELDNRVRTGELEPVFEMFRIYRERSRERLEFAIALLEEPIDFDTDETFRFDRSDLAWPATRAELDELWRKRVKNDALSLVLAGREWEEAAETLGTRYRRMLTRLDQINSDDVFESFMNAFAQTMDPHTSYLSPRNSEEYRIQMSLSYDGIGASLQIEDDLVMVADIIPGGPAAADGTLKPRDRITGVGQGDDGDFEDVVGWRLDDVVQLIRGPGGSTVRLRVLPAGTPPGSQETVIELVRDKVRLEAQAASKDIREIERNGDTLRVGVIRVPSFYQDYAARARGDQEYTSTTRDVERLLRELDEAGVDGVVMDLRGNGGGHLTEATALAGLFLDRGPVVQLRNSRGQVEILDDTNGAPVYDGPLAVLVNRYSASASEIFAAAIQDYGRGLVIGKRTFCKGTVHNLYSLDRFMQGEGFGQLTLTIGKYYRVTGGGTQHRGVEPDIALPSPIDSSLVGESARDTALPWDQISPTRFRSRPLLSQPAISLLTHLQDERTQSDPDMDFLLGDIAAFRDMREREEVSLNLEVRRAEREMSEQARLARENARREARGLPLLPDLEALGQTEAPDVILDQAADIVADMVHIGMLAPDELERLAAALR
ncbi:MAG: carboxy terminal-processing peptidase [Gammaproteobacteria bacterium]|nr:carboxy terminal-processing peptidase [Gammaproteobacteria bacterium]